MDNRVVRYQSGGPQWRRATGEDGSGPGRIRRCDGGWRWAAGSVVTTSRHGLDAEVAWRCEAREGEVGAKQIASFRSFLAEETTGSRRRGEVSGGTRQSRGRVASVEPGGRRKAESQVRRSTQGPAAIACPGCSALCSAAWSQPNRPWSQQALPGQLVQRGEGDLERPKRPAPMQAGAPLRATIRATTARRQCGRDAWNAPGQPKAGRVQREPQRPAAGPWPTCPPHGSWMLAPQSHWR